MKNRDFNKTNILIACVITLLLVVSVVLIVNTKHNSTRNIEVNDSIEQGGLDVGKNDTSTVEPSVEPISEDATLPRFKKLLEDEMGPSIGELVTDVDIISSEQKVVFGAGSTVSYEDLYSFFRDENASGYGDDEPYIFYSHLYADSDAPLLLVRFSSNDGYPEENCAIIVLQLSEGACHIKHSENTLNTESALLKIAKNNICISEYHPMTNITNSSYDYLHNDGSLTHLYDLFYTGFYNIPQDEKYAEAFEAADVNDYDYLDVWVLEYDISGKNYVILNDGAELSEDGVLFKKECEKRGITFSDKSTIDEAIKAELTQFNLDKSAVLEESVEWILI